MLRTQEQLHAMVEQGRTWKQRYPEIELLAKDILRDIPADASLTQRQLVLRMADDWRGPGAAEFIRAMHHALRAIARYGLKGWWHEGAPGRYMGNDILPRMWHAGPAEPVKPFGERIMSGTVIQLERIMDTYELTVEQGAAVENARRVLLDLYETNAKPKAQSTPPPDLSLDTSP